MIDITDEDFANFKPAAGLEFLDPNEDLGEGIVSGFSSIRYKGKAWALRHRGETYYFETPVIDVVILARSPKIAKAYYDGAYDDDAEGRAPVCSSIDGEHIDAGVSDPQAKTCSVCKHNEWTTINGRRGKECQDHRRMAVLLMPAVTKKMLGAALLEPVFFKVPPGSLLASKSYGAFLKERNIHFAQCTTKLGFAPPNVSLFQITFSFGQRLTDHEVPFILPLLKGDETRRLIGEAKIIREIEEVPFDPPKKVETGISEAFNVPSTQVAKQPATQEVIPPRRGRPPGSKNKPKEETEQAGAVSGFAVEHSDVPVKPQEPFQQADDELSRKVAALITDD